MPSKKKWPTVMPAELAETLGDRMRKSLKRSGLSIGDMTEFLGVHRNTISGWLADRSRPMALFLRVWAETVGVPLSWLVDGKWPECQEFERRSAPARKAPAERKARAKRSPAECRRTAG